MEIPSYYEIETCFGKLQEGYFRYLKEEAASFLYEVIINSPKRFKNGDFLKLAEKRNSLQKRLKSQRPVCEQIVTLHDWAKENFEVGTKEFIEGKVYDFYSEILQDTRIISFA